jgi:UDP-N-acetylglucosamine--N-acetylmuramyl-(pentapeptide) pyrophosphoryl-undecaprenol N-acetylglucosamine transferase
VYPLLAVAEALDACTDGKVELLYIGSVGGMEVEIVARTGIPYRAVDAAPIRGVTPWRLLGNVFHLWRGYRQASRILAEWVADAVLVSGAYVSVPVAFAAWRRRIPVLVYLPDREPGLAVRLLSRFVDRIAVSFDQVRFAFAGIVQHKVWVSGYPVRAALLNVDREHGLEALNLSPRIKTLLVMGGSRGARPINCALVATLSDLLPHCQVLHVTGRLDWPWVEDKREKLSMADKARYQAFPYLHEKLPAAMAAADLVVARAGASTLAEFPAVGLPSILVPYPYSGQHQEANVDFMVERGASFRIDDAALDATLGPTVLRLLRDEHALERMQRAAHALARPDAALQLANELCRMAERNVL